jgi:hypothetical protein
MSVKVLVYFLQMGVNTPVLQKSTLPTLEPPCTPVPAPVVAPFAPPKLPPEARLLLLGLTAAYALSVIGPAEMTVVRTKAKPIAIDIAMRNFIEETILLTFLIKDKIDSSSLVTWMQGGCYVDGW